MVSIRKAEPADFESMARLICNEITWNRYGINYPMALQLLKSAEDEFYLAHLGQDIVAFTALRLNGVGNFGAYTRIMVVAQAYRNHGIGKKLLDHVWDLATEYMPHLFLLCSIDNVRAQKFYEREGFKKVGTLEGLILQGYDEILYWKSATNL